MTRRHITNKNQQLSIHNLSLINCTHLKARKKSKLMHQSLIKNVIYFQYKWQNLRILQTENIINVLKNFYVTSPRDFLSTFFEKSDRWMRGFFVTSQVRFVTKHDSIVKARSSVQFWVNNRHEEMPWPKIQRLMAAVDIYRCSHKFLSRMWCRCIYEFFFG